MHLYWYFFFFVRTSKESVYWTLSFTWTCNPGKRVRPSVHQWNNICMLCKYSVYTGKSQYFPCHFDRNELLKLSNMPMSAMVSIVRAYHFIKLLLLSFQFWCIWNSHTNFTPRFTFSKINMQFCQDCLTCVVYLARCTCSDYAAFDGLATICLSNIHYQRLHKGKMWHRPLNDHPLGASACVLGKLVVSK